ncbi:MAG: hypothetical protein JSU65_03790 [Candidatus Zixiibacteriota bacterium]|nr:MAG: hypothetical protein JSU65_03790 [candidate division Zixibacteria bacterium]
MGRCIYHNRIWRVDLVEEGMDVKQADPAGRIAAGEMMCTRMTPLASEGAVPDLKVRNSQR